MTRATLLRLLAHPTALNGADVRALEELAEAFPYCQTAHLLLAKAAHDQGSMLASQRLRRAATYAADRTLLRQLIETTAEEETLVPVTAEALAGEALPAPVEATSNWLAAAPPAANLRPAEFAAPRPAPLIEDQPAQEIAPAPTLAPLPAAATEATPLLPIVATELPPIASPEVAEPSAQPVAEPADAASLEAIAPTTITAPDESVPAATSEVVTESAADIEAATVTDDDYAVTSPIAPAAQESPGPIEAVELFNAADSTIPVEVAELSAPAASSAEADSSSPAPDQNDALPVEQLGASPVLPSPEANSADFLGAEAADELPAQAPPIRPPAEAEVASHEFGLAAAEPAEVTAYQLPELELAITVPLTQANATPRLPPFSGVADVAYAPGEGSRYGFCLVPAGAAELASQLVPAASLPPAGDFFVPDALVLAHVAEQPEVPANSTNDLINNFLQRSPAASRRRTQAPATGVQADLSIRSTRVAPDLASESLALILVKQGKIEQAIVVYERLVVKNPEKSAYFAAQIETLRPLA